MGDRPPQVDLGHAWAYRYRFGAPMHACRWDAATGTWVLLCTGGRAAWQYRGWVHVATCDACRRQLAAQGVTA